MSIDISLNAAASGDGHLFHIDIGNFFLEHDLPEPVYIIMPFNFIPQQTKDYYHLQPLINSKTGEKFVYMKQVKAVYGLKQSNATSEKELKVRLATHGYHEVSPGKYRHETKHRMFDLHVDDSLGCVFGTHQEKLEAATDLINILSKYYKKVKVNLCGLNETILPRKYKLDFCGMDIYHDRDNCFVETSMHDYYNKLVAAIPDNIKPTNTPGKCFNIKYGSKEQQQVHDAAPVTLTPDQEKTLQKFCGMALWYSQVAVETLVALSRLSSQIKSPTNETVPFFEFLQGYFKTYGNHVKRFYASDMILQAWTDASFDNESKSRSRGGTVLLLGNKDPSLINGPILWRTHILPGAPRSAAEAEIEQEFDTGDYILQAKNILEAIGYPQKVNIILADNMCAIDYANDQNKGSKLKSLERRLNWLKYQVENGAFVFQYVTSENNLADLFTKLLPSDRHHYLTNFLVTKKKMLLTHRLNELQGCVRLH
jgi:hypothetical protein